MLKRMLRAARLEVGLYEEVEGDKSALGQAMLVVVLVAIATGLANLSGAGSLGLVVGVLWGLAGWALWAWLTYFIGTKLLAAPQTQSNWGEMARTLGFAQSPGVLRVLGLIPGLGTIIVLITGVWQLVTMVVAVRQALDYTSTWRAVAVVLIGFIPYAIVLALISQLA
ncbi:MAG: YIP1 family protein [Chloroflexi bacterium]|nr:YIP1 family protein [Chloroflexota bacterium]